MGEPVTIVDGGNIEGPVITVQMQITADVKESTRWRKYSDDREIEKVPRTEVVLKIVPQGGNDQVVIDALSNLRGTGSRSSITQDDSGSLIISFDPGSGH